MAFPTIPTVAAGRVLTTNQLDSSGTRTFPSLSSLTKNSGDLLIAIIVGYQTSTGTNAAFSSWGASFTEFHDSATSTTMAMGAAYKWSDGTETGTFTVTQAGTITGDASMILLSIPGAHASTPPEAGSRQSGTTSAADPGAFDPSGWGTEDTLWISVLGSGCTNISGAWAGCGSSGPTNYSSYVDTAASDTSTIGDCEAAVSFRQNATGSEDVGTAGVDTSNARNGAFVIAVRPAPPTVTGTAASAQTLTATATGTRTVGGTAAQAITLSLTATGGPVRSGTAASAQTLTATATGTRTVLGVAACAITLTAAASGTAGTPPVTGTAAQAITLTLAATGTRTVSGSGACALALTAAGTGTVTHPGTAARAITLAASAAGTVTHPGSAAQALALTLAAVGARTVLGSGACAVTLTAGAAGTGTGPGVEDPSPYRVVVSEVGRASVGERNPDGTRERSRGAANESTTVTIRE